MKSCGEFFNPFETKFKSMSAYAKSLRAGHGYGFSSTSGRMLFEAETIGKAVHINDI